MRWNFHADPARNKVAIYSGTDDLPMDDSLGYIHRVKWASDLAFFRIAGQMTGSLTLPLRTQNLGYWVTTPHLIGPHGQTGDLWPIIQINGRDVPSERMLQTVTNNGVASFRTAAMSIDATNVYVDERHMISFSANGPDLPAITIDYDIILLSVAAPVGGGELVHIDPAAGRFRLGNAQFDIANRYLRQTESAPDLYILSGRSIDTADDGGTASRQWNSDGSVDTQTGYAGTYAGPERIGLAG